jgi:hypothetical protein
MISIGTFTIDWHNVDFDDVYILQQNNYLLSALCDMMGSRFETLQSTICRCWKGDYLSGKQLGFIPKNRWFDSFYCSYRPCSDSRVAMGDCHVDVDPFLHSCIQIYSVEEYKDLNVVRYTSTVPTMLSAGHLAVAVADSLESLTEDIDAPSSLLETMIRLNKRAGELSLLLFSHTPKYLFNLVIGAILFIYSETLASSTLFQYSLAGSLGLVLALAWFILSLYR